MSSNPTVTASLKAPDFRVIPRKSGAFFVPEAAT